MDHRQPAKPNGQPGQTSQIGSSQSDHTLEASWFNNLTGGSSKSVVCAREVLDVFASQVAYWKTWNLETGSGGEVSLQIQTHEPGVRLTLLISIQEHELLLVFTPDISGWLRMTVLCEQDGPDSVPLFEGWIDQPYEEFEFWPSIEQCADIPIQHAKRQIAPGRMGKRMNWISIETRAWPQSVALQKLSNAQGFIVASQPDGDGR